MPIIASVLYLCINPTWAGCGVVHIVDYGTTEACRTALESMKFGANGTVAVGDNGKAIVAYCRPPFEAKP